MEIVKTLHVKFLPFDTGVPARNVTVKSNCMIRLVKYYVKKFEVRW